MTNRLRAISIPSIVAALLAALIFGWGRSAASEVDDTTLYYVIDVTDGGFDPAACLGARRPLSLRFTNTGTLPHNVVMPDAFPGQPPLWQSGVLQPGQSSTGYVLIFAGTTTFYDGDDPSRFFSISVPVVGPESATCPTDPAGAPPPRTPSGISACVPRTVCALAPGLAADR